MSDSPSIPEVARCIAVTPATLRRWVRDGVVPLHDGAWTPAAVAHARFVGHPRARRALPRGGAGRRVKVAVRTGATS